MQPVIELRKLTFSYSTQAEDESAEVMFHDFSLKIEKGARLIVKGRSGAGKSTFLRLLSWLEEPLSGQISFNGKPYLAYDPPDLRKMVSLVGQKPIMLGGTVRQNLLLGCDEEPPNETLYEWLQLFGLEKGIMEKVATTLSIGQQQRVAVIRTLLLNPQVLLLDEPTAGLDPESIALFLSAMRSLVQKNDLTLVWVSHNYLAVKSIATDTLTITGAMAQ